MEDNSYKKEMELLLEISKIIDEHHKEDDPDFALMVKAQALSMQLKYLLDQVDSVYHQLKITTKEIEERKKMK